MWRNEEEWEQFRIEVFGTVQTRILEWEEILILLQEVYLRFQKIYIKQKGAYSEQVTKSYLEAKETILELIKKEQARRGKGGKKKIREARDKAKDLMLWLEDHGAREVR